MNSRREAHAGAPEDHDSFLTRAVPPLANDYLAFLIVCLGVRLERGASFYYRRQWGVGATEYRVIMAMGRGGECNVAGVAAEADIDKSAASRALRTLKSKGVVSIQADGRASVATLTKNGVALYRDIKAASQKREKRFTRGFTAAEANRLKTDLQRLLRNINPINAD
jgi:DNA-binding MarR family transcriptional regulator